MQIRFSVWFGSHGVMRWFLWGDWMAFDLRAFADECIWNVLSAVPQSSGRCSGVMVFLFRWTQACRMVLHLVWSWRLLSSLTKTPTGWPPSLLPAGSCSCCATMVTGRIARLTSGVTSWQLTCTPSAGVSRTRRFSKCLKVMPPCAEEGGK